MKWQLDLKRDIRFGNEKDDIDFGVPEIFPDLNRCRFWREPYRAFSFNDGKKLLEQFTSIKDKCRVILEIGVDRNGRGEGHNYVPSSSDVLIENKNKETIYLGIDIDDKSYLDAPENNIYTLRCQSQNFEKVREKLKSLGVEEIDFYFIDGWHSINQVLLEWEYTDLLSPYGIVGFHDTRYHPGPRYFINNLDTSRWNVIPDACVEYDDDWGIGFASKK